MEYWIDGWAGGRISNVWKRRRDALACRAEAFGEGWSRFPLNRQRDEGVASTFMRIDSRPPASYPSAKQNEILTNRK